MTRGYHAASRVHRLCVRLRTNLYFVISPDVLALAIRIRRLTANGVSVDLPVNEDHVCAIVQCHDFLCIASAVLIGRLCHQAGRPIEGFVEDDDICDDVFSDLYVEPIFSVNNADKTRFFLRLCSVLAATEALVGAPGDVEEYLEGNDGIWFPARALAIPSSVARKLAACKPKQLELEEYDAPLWEWIAENHASVPVPFSIEATTHSWYEDYQCAFYGYPMECAERYRGMAKRWTIDHLSSCAALVQALLDSPAAGAFYGGDEGALPVTEVLMDMPYSIDTVPETICGTPTIDDRLFDASPEAALSAALAEVHRMRKGIAVVFREEECASIRMMFDHLGPSFAKAVSDEEAHCLCVRAVIVALFYNNVSAASSGKILSLESLLGHSQPAPFWDPSIGTGLDPAALAPGIEFVVAALVQIMYSTTSWWTRKVPSMLMHSVLFNHMSYCDRLIAHTGLEKGFSQSDLCVRPECAASRIDAASIIGGPLKLVVAAEGALDIAAMSRSIRIDAASVPKVASAVWGSILVPYATRVVLAVYGQSVHTLADYQSLKIPTDITVMDASFTYKC